MILFSVIVVDKASGGHLSWFFHAYRIVISWTYIALDLSIFIRSVLNFLSCLLVFLVFVLLIIDVFLFLHHCSGVSSFNQFIHELSVDSDGSSSVDYSSGEEDSDDNIVPASPLSQSSRVSRARSFNKFDRRLTRWTRLIFSMFLCPVKRLLGIPLYLFHSLCYRGVANPCDTHSSMLSRAHSTGRVQALKDHFIQRTTDRRRGVIEVSSDVLCHLLLVPSFLLVGPLFHLCVVPNLKSTLKSL